MNGKSQQKKKEQQPKFTIFKLEVFRPTKTQKAEIDELIGQLPFELFNRPNANLVVTRWLTSLTRFQRDYFCFRASELKSKSDEILLEALKDIAVAKGNVERIRKAEKAGLWKEKLHPKSALKFGLCLEELKRKPAPQDRRELDETKRQNAWQHALDELEKWSTDPANRELLDLFLAPLDGSQCLEELTKLCQLDDAGKTTYLMED